MRSDVLLPPCPDDALVQDAGIGGEERGREAAEPPTGEASCWAWWGQAGRQALTKSHPERHTRANTQVPTVRAWSLLVPLDSSTLASSACSSTSPCVSTPASKSASTTDLPESSANKRTLDLSR
jgi:hypothetical protein